MSRPTRFILIFLMVLSFKATGTHNRAGEITYTHLFGNTYEFTITTCTKTSSEADRDELEIFWGDGTSDILPRTNINFITGANAQKNFYVGQHTYTGAGTYVVEVEDPNRNEGVLNITQSVLVPFCIQTTIKITPFLGPDNSIQIEGCPCPEYACFNKKWCYNVKAYDPDGDSLSYQLVPCRGENCDELLIPAQYIYPNDVGGGALTIDEQTGTICWDSPQVLGEYNFAVLITSWRAGQFISSVLHDLQITVTNCLNDPPILNIPPDTCIVAGDSISLPILASDINGDDITLTATGTPFNLGASSASFTSNSPDENVVGSFNWQTNCSHPQQAEYQIVFEATDDGAGVNLSDIQVMRIRVVPPPIENVTVNPQGGSMNISWDASTCTNVSEYRIYRSTSPLSGIDDCCIGFEAADAGFELLGTTDPGTLNYLDNDNLVIGNEYCYFVTALLENGVESCPSDTDCDQLKLEVPIITHVSVVTTDNVNGTDTIIWAPPKELQASVFPGPYEYRVYRGQGFTGNNEALIHTTPQSTVLENTDTIYHDTEGIDNFSSAFYYRVELYSEGDLVGTSNKASSVFLTTTPNDNEIALSWTFDVPWTNYEYEVYREDPTGSGNFTPIATTTATEYTDTGLVNLVEYCYKVKAIGEYTAPGIVSPLINWSQEACDEPFDFTPPCPPTVSIESECETGINTLTWNNPNNDCEEDDAMSYTVYYTPVEGGDFEPIAQIDNVNDTVIVFENLESVAGCYYVTATDSVQYNNESDSSNIVCVDNCPIYELPNVFTPDGNNSNDLFHPILPYRHIESIDLTIFNRWGKPVFSTTDPDINWDGTYLDSGDDVTEGVYYYICQINTIRLSGIETIEIQGNVHLIRN